MFPEGMIEPFQLLTVARALRGERFTGFLDLSKGDEHVQLTFLQGEIVYTRSEDVRRSFPAFLLKHKLVERDAMRESLNAAQTEGVSLNKVLLEKELVTLRDLLRAMQGMSRYLIAYAFSLAPAKYTLTPLENPPAILPKFEIHIENGLFQYISSQDDIAIQSGTLRNHFDSTIVSTDAHSELLPILLQEFHGSQGDPVVEAISEEGASISGLLAGGHPSDQIVRRVFAMLVAGMIRFDEETKENGWDSILFELSELSRAGGNLAVVPEKSTATKASPAPAPSQGDLTKHLTMLGPTSTQEKSDAIAALTAVSEAGPKGGVETALLETLQRLQDESIYGVLGIPADASLTDIKEKCRSLSNKYDPKSYASFMLSKEAEQALSIIAEHIQVAWAVLSDISKRRAFHEHAGISDLDMRVTLENLAESANISGQASKAMEAKDYQGAQNLLAKAILLVPHDAAMQANFAWICFQGVFHGALDAKEFKSLISKHVKSAHEINPKSEHVLRVQARIARMEGRNKDAVEAYQRLLSVNARDEEARTGVRTLRNQADGKALSGDDAGVVDRISGIFKKK